MNEKILWLLFERGICLWENFMLVEFVTRFLGMKFSGRKGRLAFLCAWGVLFGLSFLEHRPLLMALEPLITMPILLLYSWLCLKGSLAKKLFASVVARGLTMVSNSFVLFTASYLIQQNVEDFIREQDLVRVITVLLTKITYLIAGRLILGLAEKGRRLLPWQWAITGTSLFFSTMAGNIAIRLGGSLEFHQKEQFQLFLLLICVWSMCLVTNFAASKMGKANEQRMEYALLKQRQAYQEKSLETVKTSNEELRQVKHDMKNYMMTVNLLIQRQEYEQAARACEELGGRIEQVQALVETGNESVDAILNGKLSESKRRGIDTKCTVFAVFSPGNVLDFCAVLGNLMDNAMEAEEKLPSEQRSIQVSISNQFGFLELMVSNRIADSVLKTNAALETSKEKGTGHGLGHKSVEKCMRDCGGSIQYLEKTQTFIARARFPRGKEHECR